MVYFIVFCISAILISCDRQLIIAVGDKKTTIHPGHIITIFLLTLLVAFRASSVGSDTLNYFISFSHAKRIDLTSWIKTMVYEPGYSFVESVFASLFGEIGFLFAFETIITLAGLFGVMSCFKGKINESIALLAYLTMFFNSSLNTSRQYFALGIGLIGSKFLLNGEKKKYLLLSLAAFSIHSTAILLFIAYFVWEYIGERGGNRKALITLIVFTIGCIFIQPLTKIMGYFGLIRDKYSEFFIVSESSSSLFKTFIAAAPILFLVIMYYKSLVQLDRKNVFVITMSLFGVGFSFINTFWGNVGRAGLYFTIWQVILIGECYKLEGRYRGNVSNVIAKRLLYILLLFGYWYYTIMLRNFHHTIPYVLLAG